jgi:hypothetical protein
MDLDDQISFDVRNYYGKYCACCSKLLADIWYLIFQKMGILGWIRNQFQELQWCCLCILSINHKSSSRPVFKKFSFAEIKKIGKEK